MFYLNAFQFGALGLLQVGPLKAARTVNQMAVPFTAQEAILLLGSTQLSLTRVGVAST